VVTVTPPAASSMAAEVDRLYAGLLAVTGLVLLLVFVLLLTFAIRYRRGSDADRGDRIRKSWRWEVSWTTATLIAFVALFFWGADLYARLYTPPADAVDIYVVGKQWMWKIQHPDGQREINELHVPLNRPVRLVMTSQDVIHSFYVPAFRLKHDVLPGRYEALWFKAVTPGEYPILCAEFCGTEHAHMIGRVVVLEPAAYERWLGEGAPQSLAAAGEAVFRAQGCSGCHGANSTVHAPSLEGLYGRQVPLQDGSFVTVDERYIRDSILRPRAEIAAGYAPIMPSFAGRIEEEEMTALIAYIKSLGTRARSEP
jgi:cytochrome c oxidase subunit 2